MFTCNPASEPGVRVDVAGDDAEPNAMALEERGEAREVGELPCEPIGALDDDAVDVSLLDALQELGSGISWSKRTLGTRAGTLRAGRRCGVAT